VRNRGNTVCGRDIVDFRCNRWLAFTWSARLQPLTSPLLPESIAPVTVIQQWLIAIEARLFVALVANLNDEPLRGLPADVGLARRNATGRRKCLECARPFHGIKMSFIGADKKKRRSVTFRCIPSIKMTRSRFLWWTDTWATPCAVRFALDWLEMDLFDAKSNWYRTTDYSLNRNQWNFISYIYNYMNQWYMHCLSLIIHWFWLVESIPLLIKIAEKQWIIITVISIALQINE